MRLARKLALLASGIAMVAVARTGQAQALPNCAVDGTLADLVGFGASGCVVGDKVFYNFHSHIVPAPGATPIDEADIHYDIINPNPLTEGFLFTSTWHADAGFVFDQSLRYSVRTLSGAATILGMHLSMGGDFINPSPTGAPGTGFARIDEELCAGDFILTGCTGGNPFNLSVFHLANGSIQHNDFATWTIPVDVIDIQKDIRLDGGNGGAGFSIMDQYVTQTPEPASLALMGTGLALLGVVARRRRRA